MMLLLLLLLVDDCWVLDGISRLLITFVMTLVLVLILLLARILLIQIRVLILQFNKTPVRIFVALVVLLAPLTALTVLFRRALMLLVLLILRWGRRHKYLYGGILR